jgi:hypothetical protein
LRACTSSLAPTFRRANKIHGERPGAGRCRRPPRADGMARKLLTVGGRGIYARRKSIVLPEIGQSSTRGLRSFLLRGLMKVKEESVAHVHDAQHL